MYKKKIITKFNKDGYTVEVPNISYENISMCFVSVLEFRKTLCKIKNSPIYYYVIEGNGIFHITDRIMVNKGDFIEIPANSSFTYSGNMRLLEIIPNSFVSLEIEEKPVK